MSTISSSVCRAQGPPGSGCCMPVKGTALDTSFGKQENVTSLYQKHEEQVHRAGEMTCKSVRCQAITDAVYPCTYRGEALSACNMNAAITLLLC